MNNRKKIQNLNDEALNIFRSEPDRARDLAISAYSLSLDTTAMLDERRWALHRLLLAYEIKGLFKVAIEVFEQKKEQLNLWECSISSAKVQLIAAVNYYRAYRFEEAMFLVSNSINFFKRLKDSNGLCQAYNCLANIYIQVPQYENALYYFDKVRQIAHETQNKTHIFLAELNVAYLYNRIKKSVLANSHIKKAEAQLEDDKLAIYESRLLFSKANKAKNDNRFEEALEIISKVKDTDTGISLFNGAYIDYLYAQIYNGTNLIDKSLKAVESALQKLKAINNTGEIFCKLYVLKCQLLNKIGDYGAVLDIYEFSLKREFIGAQFNCKKGLLEHAFFASLQTDNRIYSTNISKEIKTLRPIIESFESQIRRL